MPFSKILSDARISPTDKLVAIALLSIGEQEIRCTNKEIADMICSAETVVSRSLKALVVAGIITTTLENQTKRVIKTLIKNARVQVKSAPKPLTITQAPLTITQGYRLHPLIKLLTPLNNNARGINNNARVFRAVHFENQDFIKMNPYNFKKSKSKGDIYILFISYKVSITYKSNYSKSICRQKKKEYDLQFDSFGVASCQALREACLFYHQEHPEKYSADMYKKFIKYWSEPDKKGVPKWYAVERSKGKNWHLPGRLSTWFSNDFGSQKEAKIYQPIQAKGNAQRNHESAMEAYDEIIRERGLIQN